MSESSLLSEVLSHATLEQALRDIVHRAYKTGDLNDLTVKRVRTAAEKSLDLEDGFYKNDPSWKEESRRIIQSEVDAHEPNSPGDPSNSQHSSQTKVSPIAKEEEEASALKKDVKRTSAAAPRSKKRKNEIDEQNSESEIPKFKKRPVGKSEKSMVKSSTPLLKHGSDIDTEIEPVLEEGDIGDNPESKSESEMSVVIDEKPKRKSKNRDSGSGKPSSKKTARSRASRKSDDKPTDADADEIKRLQGWLIKCGIRKMWFKELAPYESPKLKIEHLKKMLSDAGMTGRYSIEKATHIRNERELRADLEAVQEGDKQWGKGDSNAEDPAKPRRKRVARGLQELDAFLNGSDGEETD